jgi:hypothetical protein
MSIELNQTTKAIVLKMKQDPKCVKVNPFKDLCHSYITRITNTAKFQPQDTSNAIGSVEENKEDGQMHLLLKYVTSFIEIYEAFEKQTNRNLD